MEQKKEEDRLKIIQKNFEQSKRAEQNMETLNADSVVKYEARQELIKQKEQEKEAQRKQKAEMKQAELEQRKKEMDKRKLEYELKMQVT